MMGHRIQTTSDYTCLNLDMRGRPALRARDFTFDIMSDFILMLFYIFSVMLFYF